MNTNSDNSNNNNNDRSIHHHLTHGHSNDSVRGQEEPQRTASDLLRIPPGPLSTNWLSSFRAAKIDLLIPFDSPDSKDPVSRHEFLSSWQTEPVEAPRRKSVYWGETLKVYVILSLSPPATAEPEGRHDIETHLKTHLSLRFHLDLLPDPANDPSTLSTNTHLERKIPVPVAISRPNKSPMSSPLGYSSSPLSPIPHTPLSGQIESKIPDPLKVVRLFTASYSNPTSIESKSSDSNRFKVDQKPLDPSRTPELESDAQLKIQVDQTADQWLVVWEACCKVGMFSHRTLSVPI